MPILEVSRPGRVRIVYLSASGQLGGAERCLLDVLTSVRGAEPDWELILLSSREGPLVERAQRLGVAAGVVAMPESVARLGDSGAQGVGRRAAVVAARAAGGLGALMTYRRRLRRAVAHRAPDIVHSNGYKMHLMSSWSRPATAALVWHLHDYVSSRPLMMHAMKWCSRACDAGIAVSESVARDVAPVWRGRGPVHVVMNGVDLDVFRPEGPRADLDALSGLPRAPEGTVRVGLVATMGRFKGHEVFLRAVARVAAGRPVRAYVVGGPLYETTGSEVELAHLRMLAGALGVGDRVGFTGFVAEPQEVMRALDIVVHATTVPEPFGLVIAEGMACGRAVIVSGAGGAREIVHPEKDALVHEPGDVESLARMMARLADDAGLRARLAGAGRATAEARFDRRRLGAEMAVVYRAAAARRAGRRGPT